MADDVTLLPCPFCGSYDVRTVHGTDDRTILVSCGKCHALVQEWGDKAITLWNSRIPNPRVAALEAELAEARARNSTLADTADALRAELGGARKALAASGIGGIYDVFQDVTDAIEQMALYIKERDRRARELEDELARLRPLAEVVEGMVGHDWALVPPQDDYDNWGVWQGGFESGVLVGFGPTALAALRAAKGEGHD